MRTVSMKHCSSSKYNSQEENIYVHIFTVTIKLRWRELILRKDVDDKSETAFQGLNLIIQGSSSSDAVRHLLNNNRLTKKTLLILIILQL